MNRRIATLILVFGGMISSFLYAEGRQVIPFNEGWKFKKAPVLGEYGSLGKGLERSNLASYVE